MHDISTNVAVSRKCQRATGLNVTFSGGIPRLVATRLSGETAEEPKKLKVDDDDGKNGSTASGVGTEAAPKTAAAEAAAAAAAEEDAEVAAKTAETMKIDRLAISHLSVVLMPLVVGFSLRSLVCEQHHGWYSWLIAALTGTVYTFGFILMTPQLFINHHLKSVSHLPWRFLCFRFVNTFIDDLFAFIIRMPTMHRIR